MFAWFFLWLVYWRLKFAPSIIIRMMPFSKAKITALARVAESEQVRQSTVSPVVVLWTIIRCWSLSMKIATVEVVRGWVISICIINPL